MGTFFQKTLGSIFTYGTASSGCRFYSRNILKRRPVRVFNVPPEMNLEPIQSNVLRPKIDNSIESYKERAREIMVPAYEKLEQSDVRLMKLMTNLKSKKLRMAEGKILLEGKRLINDAIAAGIPLEVLYFTRESDLADIKLRERGDLKIYKVLYKTMKVWSDVMTCQGVMAVCNRPKTDDMYVLNEAVLPVTLICDNIRDPGNLGSIIRNAAAAGCQHIFLMKGCADPWESKVLRTGCGGHFRIPIIHNIEWTHIANYIPKDATLYIADNSGDIEGIAQTPEFIDYCDIPNETTEEEEARRYMTTNENNQTVVVDETFDEPSELEKYEDVDLPCYLYSSIKYPKENVVLYVGGETHGVDSRIVKLACEFGGRKVKVPMEGGMESLNSAFAMTVILYEIKRQFVEKYVLK